MERKTLKFELKSLDEETGVFEGYAATFSKTPDSYGDVIEPGAFAKTLQEGTKRIKILWNHNVNEPIGKPLEIKEDAKGLWIKGKLSLGVQRAREVFSLMQDGVINELSIGYDTIIGKMQGATRHLYELRVWDTSPVTFAANSEAAIMAVKENAMNDWGDDDLEEAKALPEGLPDEDVVVLKELENTLSSLASFDTEYLTELEADNEDIDALIECIDIFLEPTKGGPGSGPQGGGGGGRRGGKRLMGLLRRKRGAQLSELRNLRTMKLSSPRSEALRGGMIKSAQKDLASTRREMVRFRNRPSKSGRVLSAANLGKVQAALDALQALLEAAASEEEPAKATPPPDEKSQEAAELEDAIAGIEAELKGFARADAEKRIDALIKKMEVTHA